MPSPSPIRPTRKPASATTTTTASCRPACCRSRTSSTAPSAPSAASIPGSAADTETSAAARQAMAREHRNSFVRFALAESTLHKASLKGLELPREAIERFTGLADWSLERQREIEGADKVPFEPWRQKYLSHDTLVV